MRADNTEQTINSGFKLALTISIHSIVSMFHKFLLITDQLFLFF